MSSEEHARLRRRSHLRNTLTAYLFLLPIILAFIVFTLIPVGWLFVSTFRVGGVLGPARYVGLANWEKLLSDPLVLRSIVNTIQYSLIAIPTVFVIAMVLALALQVIPRGGAPIRVSLYLPTLLAAVVAALMWVFLLHPDFGIFGLFSQAVGREPTNFLGSTTLALPTIAMIEVWRGVGFWTMLFLAGLVGLPRELYLAAELDGASAITRFRRLTIPLMKPTFFFAVIFATIVNLQLFDSVFVLTDGGPVNSTATVALYIYRSLFSFGNIGFGAALSFLLVVVVLALTGLQTYLGRSRH